MSRLYLCAMALGVGLTFIPVTVGMSDDATTARLAVSEACAMASDCCSFSLGDLCLLDNDVIFNYRPGGGICEQKPGT